MKRQEVFVDNDLKDQKSNYIQETYFLNLEFFISFSQMLFLLVHA